MTFETRRLSSATAAPWVGVIAAAIAGAPSSMLFAFLVLTLGSNQVATGLALAIFGIGLSSLIGASYVGMAITAVRPGVPRLRSLPIPIGKLVFGYSPLVYFALIMVFAVDWFLNRTRAGLVLRAVGENDLSRPFDRLSGDRRSATPRSPSAARWRASRAAYFSMVITPMWAEQMTAGRGWIALALVVFSGWRAGPSAGRRLFLRDPVHDARALRQGVRVLVPAVAVLGSDALRHGHRRARASCRRATWPAARRPLASGGLSCPNS